MAYLGNGIYDLLDVARASANPQINYEGLYQDPMPNVITFNPLKAMTPGYTFSEVVPSYFDKNPDMASPGGNFYDDISLRMDFERANQGLPLYNRYYDFGREGRFIDFNPRVGNVTPVENVIPFQRPFNMSDVSGGIMTQAPDFKRFQGITEETDIDDDTQDEYYGEENKKKSSGLESLLRNVIGYLVPGSNLFTGDRSLLQGIRSLNQRLRSTDFGRSQNLAEYFQKVRERKQAARAQENFRDVYDSAREQGFTNDRGGFSTDKADDAGTSLGSGQFSPSSPRGRSGY